MGAIQLDVLFRAFMILKTTAAKQKPTVENLTREEGNMNRL